MWYDINCKDRILAWREWRRNLNDMEWNTALLTTAQAWDMCPRVNHYLEPDKVEEWPDAWTLVNENIYCDTAIALGMYYSLSLSHPEKVGSIEVYNDTHQSQLLTIAIFDHGKSTLNLIPKQVVNTTSLQETAKLIYQYTKHDLTRNKG